MVISVISVVISVISVDFGDFGRFRWFQAIVLPINYPYVEHWYLKIPSCIKEYTIDRGPIFISTPCISS